MKHSYLFIMVLLVLFSCSHIDENNRLTEVPHAKISKAVLIEDFTGQRCVNCPNATSEIERLQKEYGKENVIAVSIHSGPLAVFSNDKVLGLRTSLGDTYYDYWKVEAEPSGLIDRKGGVVLLDKWASQVHQALQTESSVELSVQAKVSEGGIIEIDLEYLAINDFIGKLQIWIAENCIVAPQMMPDGTLDREYIHNHVLRSAVNGVWGDDITWSSGKQGSISFSAPIQQDWNPQNLSVIAFVYNDSGIQQVSITDNDN